MAQYISKIKNTELADIKSRNDIKGINEQFDYKASKEYVDSKFGSVGSSRVFKGSCIYSSLPQSVQIDEYWYVTDRKSNYCWNGSQWIDIGDNLNIGFNSITLPKLDIDIREDVGEYELISASSTNGQAYYPNSKIATSFNSDVWSNIIINDINEGDVFKVTLSYINSDNMYGIIFTDNNFNVIQTDLKGTNVQQDAINYRITVPYKATKLILNSYKISVNKFSVSKLKYNKIATVKKLESYVDSFVVDTVTNNDLKRVTNIGLNKIDSSKYENKLFTDVFQMDGNYIDFPISDYANIENGIDYKFNIWFTDLTYISNTGKVSYLDKNGSEITWYSYGNPVSTSYPITSAKTIRAYSISRELYPQLTSKTIKGFTFSKDISKDYEPYKLDVSYEKIEEISVKKAEELINKNVQEISDKISMLPSTNYNNVIKSINRIGYDVYNSNTPPEQSLESFRLAYKKGFRTLLCDLRFTKDNVPVCMHDDTINSVARDSQGYDIVENIYISERTLQELNTYDYGIKKGSIYRDTKILTLDEMCNLVKTLGVELYIEIKQKPFTDEQLKIAYNIVKKYNLKNVTWAHDLPKYLTSFPTIAPNERLAIMPQSLSDSVLNEFIALKTSKNRLLWFAWDTTILNDEIVNKLIDNEIEFEIGSLESDQQIFNYFNKSKAYNYCSGIESNTIVAGKVIFEDAIR